MNVVMIMSDQHNPQFTGCYGGITRTPNLDRMAARGVQFNNAYSNAPLSSASRQSILTGKYPHATGVTLLFTPFPDEINTTLPEHLKKFDFKTGIIGKTHFNNWLWYKYYKDGLPDHGFDHQIGKADWEKHLEKNPPRSIPRDIMTRKDAAPHETVAGLWNAEKLPAPYYDEDSEGTFFANKAVEFIDQNKKDRFCLWVAFHEPHAPFSFPVEYRDKYWPGNMPLPQAGHEDTRWIPEKFKELTDEERRGIIASYYTSVEYLDKNVGMILDGLENRGLADSTLVIYLGDQGYLLNEHGRIEKHTMWEESIKAPLIVQGGKALKTGKKTEALVELIDVAPTIFKAMGVAPLEETQGKSFLPVLTQAVDTHKNYVFAEFLEDNKAMVATPEWKYIFTTGKRDLGQSYKTGHGPSGLLHKLYNLKKDPGETTNVAYHPENDEIINKLQEKMLEIFKETHPYAEEVPNALNLIGQLIWFCEPRDVGDTPMLPLGRVFEARR